MPKKTLILVLALSLFIGIFAFLAMSRSLQEPEPSVQIPASPQFNKDVATLTPELTINYRGPQKISVPETVAVYDSQPTPFLTFAEQLARQLQLPAHPKLEGLWVNPETNISINADTNVKQITFTQELSDSPSAYSSTVNQVVKTTQSFLQSLGLSHLDIDQKNMSIIEEHVEDNKIILVPITQTIDTLPLIIEAQSSNYSSVWIDKGQVVKAIFYPPVETTPITEVKLISIPEALTQIKDGKAIVTQVDKGHEYLPIGETLITSLTLTGARLEYRLDTQSNKIFPYYRFTGTTVLDKEKAKVELITLAAKL